MRNGIRIVKRSLAVLLSASMIFGMTPIQAGAEETESQNTISGNTVQTEGIENLKRGNEENTQKISNIMTVTGFVPLDESVTNQTLAIGASEGEIAFPDTMTVTMRGQTDSETTNSEADKDNADTTESKETMENAEISTELSGITWKLDETESDGAAFDSGETSNGYCYAYTPVLPETDADGNSIQLADGVELPMIYVLIGEQQLMGISNSISYLTCDSDGRNWKTATCVSATEVTSEDTEWGTSDTESWYVARGTVTISSRIIVRGTVHLILEDNCNLTVNGGIDASGTNKGNITIYAQSEGNEMGRLTAKAAHVDYAGIGGGRLQYQSGKIIINGGYISSTTARYSGCAAIGGGESFYGDVVINGGMVTATNDLGSGAGIGNGYSSSGKGSVVINGGIITAISKRGAGIGGGRKNGSLVTIKGGMITATSSEGAGIGDGNGATTSTVTITNTPVIFASSISDQSGKESNWSGMIVEGDSGKVYGSSMTVDTSFTIPAGKIIMIPENTTFAIAENTMITNSGTIKVDGTMSAADASRVTGNKPQYKLFVTNGTVDGVSPETTIDTGNTYYISCESGVSVNADEAPENKGLIGWNVSGVNITETRTSPITFSMPTNKVTISPKYGDKAPKPQLENKITAYADKLVVSALTDTDKYGNAFYSIDNIAWQSSNEFTGLSENTQYTVYARYEGKEDYAASDTESTLIKTKQRATVDNIVNQPENLSAEYGDLLSTISLPEGWSWKIPDMVIDRDTTDYTARFAPSDTDKYDYSLMQGYKLENGTVYIEIPISITVSKAKPTVEWNKTDKTIAYTGQTADASKLISEVVVKLKNNEQFKDTDKITFSYQKKATDSESDSAGDRFISGLPTELGTYEVKVHIPEDNNYTAAESTNVLTLTIQYLDGQNISEATVTAGEKTYGANDWCPVNITLKAPTCYKISLKPNEIYAETADYTALGDETTITYYLKDMTSNEIAQKSVKVKFDKTAPDWGKDKDNLGIQIKSTWWNKLLSSITFGLYKGSSLEVYANANDSQSGVAEYYYYIDNSGSTTTLTAEELSNKSFTKVAADKNGTTKLTEITSDNNYVIYAYAIDAVGNMSGYICSDGIVLDNTAPKLTNVSTPAKSNGTLSDTSATITFTGSEAGTYYYILKEDGKTAPTEMSDFATKTAGDKVDTWIAEDGVSTGTLTADEGNTIKLTKLKANTSYILYLAATDAAGNASVAESAGEDRDSGVVSVSFTTTKTIPYVKTAPVLSGNYGDTVSAMLEKADMTKASVTAGQNSDTKIEGTWTLASEDADEIPAVGTSEKYTLTFTPTGSDADTYDPVTCEVTPEVSKKQITVVISDKEKFYGETNPALTWSLATGDAYADNVLVAGDTEEALGISLSTTAKNNSNVGTYAITGLSDSANYEVSFTGSGSDGKSGVLTVKQAANSFTTALSCSGYTYAKDETPKPNATAKFGTVTYKYAKADSDGNAPAADSAYTDVIPVNAGTYAVKAYVAETDNYAGLTSDSVVFAIGKAAEPTIAGEEKSYAYSAGSDGKTIGVDIAGKLPMDKGTTTYTVAKTDTEQLLSELTVDTAGNLTYKVNQVDSSKVGKTAIIMVTASMENYANAEYTLTISITDKKMVEIKRGNTVSVDGSNVLTYGEKVSKLTLGNTVFVEAGTDDAIEGILSWSNPNELPAAGTTEAGWVFKPADSTHYAELTGTAAITVAKATPTVVTVPTVAEREYNPDAALTGSDMTGGSVTGADGSELAGTWSFTGTNIVPTVNNKGYQAVFTPTDTANYNTVTRTITVKVTKATPVIAENPTASVLTYGQTLSDSTLTGGKATCKTADGTEVAGTFVWKNATIKPTVADSQKTEYDVTFTPSDTGNYNVVDTRLTLTVNKAAKAPNMPGTTMAPAHSTKKVGDIILPEDWNWSDNDRDTALTDGVAVTATAVYTGADKGNYETESVIIAITRSECDHAHTEIRNQQEATCKKEGYTGDTYCADCGEKLATGTATEKKPHTVGIQATCVSKAVCSVCGETFGEVDATNHVHTTVKNRKEATCTQTGYAGDTYCTDCDKLLGTSKELAALGHDYKATVTKQPTTTEEGVRTYTCTRCNSSYTESIAKLPEEQHTHNYTGSITKEATCTEAGVRTCTCSCGDSYTESIPATGHSYVSKVTKAATTTEEGIMTYTCSKCGHSYTQPIAKIKADDSSKDNGSQNQKPQSGTDNSNQNQEPQPDTDNGKDNSTSIKPYIKDDSGKEGWDVIKTQLEEAKSGDTVTVAMNGTTVVSEDVMESIKGKDTALVLDMGNGLSWKINGKDITDVAGDIDFGVIVGADAGKSIPVDVINNVTGELSSLNLTLAYDGEFGFTATLTINMEAKNTGLYANLFYYNEQSGELEFVSAGQIDADGNVELEFTHASDYIIVVDAKIMNKNGQADNKADETIPAPKTDGSISKYAWNNTIIIIIGICIILIAFGAVIYVRKKNESKEE